MAASEEDSTGATYQILRNPSWRMELLRRNHINYCRHFIFSKVPAEYEEFDMSRLAFLHFVVTSLDILQSLDTLKPEEKQSIIDSVYSVMITDPPEASGFMASHTMMLRASATDNSVPTIPIHHHSTHVSMTFAALVTLITLGDTLERVDRSNVLRGIAHLQNKNGSFHAGPSTSETDMRFVYSAVAVCYMLNDFSYIEIPSLLSFIKGSLTYEGSFGSGSIGSEGHAGFTFCAIASLVLLNKLEETLSPNEISRVIRWCLNRQIAGFAGRPNKDEDTCYSFWVGATLTMLGSMKYSNIKLNIDYILHNQHPLTGGIGKHDGEYPDPLHTFMGIAGLSLANYDNLNRVNPALTMTENAVKHLDELRKIKGY